MANGQCLRTRAAPVHELLLGLALLCVTVLSSAAGPFSQLVIFGDSLSDVGNIADATESFPFVSPTPGPYYYDGRFSNGPVYSETLASGLGLPPLVYSRAGGSNFAHGGARTSGTGFPNNLVIRDVDDQVGDFLGSATVDPNALFVVFAGANDLLGGQTNMSIPVNRLATDIDRLFSAGARQFLVLNLPLLGYTPRFNSSPTNLATYNTRTEQFNTALATMLGGLEASHEAMTLYQFDTAGLFAQALADPAAFGLTNVTSPAAPGLQPGDTSYDTSQIAENPNEYMFWDDLHPTTAVHAVLAKHALALFELSGDFNRDGTVDAADYVVWRRNDGTPDDYNAWRANFGAMAGLAATAGLSGIAHFAVPEPPSSEMFLIVGMLLTAARWRG